MGACLCKTKRRAAATVGAADSVRCESNEANLCDGASSSSTSSNSPSGLTTRTRPSVNLDALSLASPTGLAGYLTANTGKVLAGEPAGDANARLWSLQNKLSLHADRLVVETLESIRPTALSEPSNAMQKLHLISETEIGWLVVINSLINKVDLEHPFGSALILLILEDAPLPTRKSIQQLVELLGLADGRATPTLPLDHERSVAKQRNTSIVLGCLAEKLAGTLSSSLFTNQVREYLLSRLALERNELVVVLYSLIALEKFSQTIENKLAIMGRLHELGPEQNPILKLERQLGTRHLRLGPLAVDSEPRAYLEQQVAFCATWELDNHFLFEARRYSHETLDRDNLNVMLNGRDVSENLKLSADGLMARNDTSRFESVRATAAITSGSYYYEVQLLTPGVMQIGFATKHAKFLNHDGFGIGDDDQSFAYDGCRQLLWQNAKSSHTNLPRWSVGDIVGCLIDLDKFEIRFSLNGQMSEPNSELFRNKPLSTQYYAAASFMPFQQCAFNFGRVPFRHPPEFHNFRALNQCAGQLREDEKYILPRHLLLKKVAGSLNIITGHGCSSGGGYSSAGGLSPTTSAPSSGISLMNAACNICCDNVAQITLEPCEHDGFCSTCAGLLDLCPLCRTTIHFRRLGTK